MKRLLLLAVAGFAGFTWWRRMNRDRTHESAYAPSSTPSAAAASDQPLPLGGDVPQDLLDILACPDDHQAVERKGNYLACATCGRYYPIRDGIPDMLIDDAVTAEQAAANPT